MLRREATTVERQLFAPAAAAQGATLAHAQGAERPALVWLREYTERLASLQGRVPVHIHLALGGEQRAPLELRVADYMAYYRAVRGRFEAFVSEPGADGPYPEPVEHCSVCPWWKRCEERRRADDHLSLVAGVTRRQREHLVAAKVTRLAELAELAPGTSVGGIAPDALQRHCPRPATCSWTSRGTPSSRAAGSNTCSACSSSANRASTSRRASPAASRATTPIGQRTPRVKSARSRKSWIACGRGAPSSTPCTSSTSGTARRTP